MPRARAEHQLQVAIVKLWQFRGRRDLDLFAIPNGGARDPITGAILKAEGVLAGVPDMGVTLDYGRTGWLEIKSKNGRLSDAQKQIRDRWQARGHLWAEVRDLKDAQIVLTLWGALRGGGKEANE